MLLKLALPLALITFLTGCGTLTGIPSHGGGKRFAIEQELVAASARGSLKELDLSSLVGRKVALYVTLMGDEGSGVMTGGRYNLEALIRGDYASSPKTSTSNEYPMMGSKAVTSAGGMESVTTAMSALNAPVYSLTQTKGSGENHYGGVRVNGQGDYRNETLITNPKDANYLTNLVQTIFFLRGIEVVSPAYADTDVFVTVDVFGTIRSRGEFYVYNNERLKAITKLEAFAVDRKTRAIRMIPQVSSFESAYQEDYMFWVGPLKQYKTVKQSEGLLVDFSDVQPYPTVAPVSSRNTKPRMNRTIKAQPEISKEVLDRRRQ
jgi:hypothetical protein